MLSSELMIAKIAVCVFQYKARCKKMVKIHLSIIAVRAFSVSGLQTYRTFSCGRLCAVLYPRVIAPQSALFRPWPESSPAVAASAFGIIEYQILLPISW